MGEVFIDTSPESLETHNKVKSAILADLIAILRAEPLGEVYGDGALVTNLGAGASTEPDLVFATWSAFDSGRLKLVKKTNRDTDYIELVGTPDIVVEVVSDSSVRKDLVTLKTAYFLAGIAEYWIVDARRDDVAFEILTRGTDAFIAKSVPGASQSSVVLAKSFRVARSKNRAGRWDYRLVSE
jgi:Uma2 family endonuclease